MSTDQSRPFVEGLGVLVHGPCVLSAGPGIGIGLRCVFAYPEGLLLSVQVKAIGQAARDAYESDIHRGSRGGRHRALLPHTVVRLNVLTPPVSTAAEGQDAPVLQHHLDYTGHTARGWSDDASATGAPGVLAHLHDIDAWWPALPVRARLTVQAGWPEVGAPLTTTVLQLSGLDRLEEGVVSLL